ncbi:MAG: site-specific DNA-methyltransferase [Candidatus Uhrbacteria bacterium]|nr:site-specific DNA-methyltransferase [Candidatus Uhrbacteria bacterium]
MEHIQTTSANIANENLDKLRKVFPQFVKDGQIDFDALKKFFVEQQVAAGEEKYGLNWVGKNDAFNAIRTPSTGTLTPQPDQSKNWDSTENLFIEGDNLEVLKLLQAHYRNSIKMIYIDPPYNTGKDFIYKDNFVQNRSDYYERTGQTQDGVKLTANPESSGRYHSDWLTMMYPRLFLARNLLKDDGVIFVSIDDNEVANLRLMMDEIFGEENFVAEIIWHSKYTVANDTQYLSGQHEYILMYAKRKEGLSELRLPRTAEMDERYSNPDNDPRGAWKATPLHAKSGNGESYVFTFTNGIAWKAPQGRFPRYSQETLGKLDAENRLWFGKDLKTTPSVKTYLAELGNARVVGDVWHYDDVGHTHSSNEELAVLMGKGMFDNPKPTRLIKRAVQLTCTKNDLILDFFVGSGTTAQAVMDLNGEDGGNRKWICVQLPEEVDEKSEAGKVGFKIIADIARERIRCAGEKIRKGDVGFKSFALNQSNYRQWEGVTEEDGLDKFFAQSQLFIEKPLVDKYDEKSVVFEILVKEGFDLNAEVKQEKMKKLNVWVVTDKSEESARRIIVSFVEKLLLADVEEISLNEHDLFVCFDYALDDTTKVNLVRMVNLKTM